MITITLDIENFYEIVNALRDSCGCDTCWKNADLLISERSRQAVKA